MRRHSSYESNWPLWPVFLFFWVGWLAFCWPWLSERVTIPWDAKAHFYPQLVFLAQALHEHTGFSWAPFVFSGAPQIADPQSLIFTPYAFLALLTGNPSFSAFDAVPFLALGAGSIALVIYFRDRGWHQAGAIVAALAFAFGGSAAWRIQHIGQILSLAYLPIVLLMLDRALLRGAKRYAIGAGVFWGLMLLGRDQVAGLSSLILAAYALTLLFQTDFDTSKRRRFSLLVLTGLVALAVIAVPVLMTGVIAAQSNRSHIDLAGAERGSLHPAALLTAFVSNLYGTDGVFERYWGPPSPRWGWLDLYIARNMSNVYSGALVTVALVYGLASRVLFARGIRFFAVTLLIALLYSVGRYTPFFKTIYTLIPGVDLFRRPADGTFLIGASASIVAGYVVHRLASGTLPRSPSIARFVAVVLLCGVGGSVGVALYKNELGYAAPMIVEGLVWLVGGCVVLLALGRFTGSPIVATMIVGCVLAADLVRNNGPNESTALPPSFYPELVASTPDPVMALLKQRTAAIAGSNRRDRIEIIGINFHAPNASLIHKLDNVLGYNPVRNKLYSAAVGANDHAALVDQRGFPPLFPSYASPLARLLGLKYIASGVPFETIDAKAPAGFATEIFRQGETRVYELPDPLPRVMLVPKFVVGDAEAIISSGKWPVDDFTQTVVLDRKPFGASNDGIRNGSVSFISATNTRVELSVDAPEGGFVVLNDPYHPWWHAYINGSTTVMFRANVLFRAVYVPPGRHRVEFVFRPLRGLGQSLSAAISGRLE